MEEEVEDEGGLLGLEEVKVEVEEDMGCLECWLSLSLCLSVSLYLSDYV